MSEPIKIQISTPDGQQRVAWTLLGKSLWEALTQAGFDPGGTCGGRGICGKCKVKSAGQLSPMDEMEHSLLLPDEINRGERVACRSTVLGQVTVTLPDERSAHDYGAVLWKTDSPGRVTCQRILLPGLDPHNPLPIHRRLRTALGKQDLMMPVETLQELSRMDRKGRPSLEVNALLMDGVVLRASRECARAYGLALDLGSTSLWAGLIDLESKETVAISSQPNMQRVFGADIISRISYCLENQDGLAELHQVLINNINAMIEDLLTTAAASVKDVYEMVVVGNPVMLHFFLGLPIAGLATHPCQGLFLDELTVTASSLDLNMNQGGKIVVVPQIGGFVGADTVSCLLNIPNWNKTKFILIDIGTNGEVVIGNRGKLWAASAAAGPALEGGQIRCGMRAAEGAIDRVIYQEEAGLAYRVIGNDYPRGICGSGVIDLTAALLKAGWIDSYGTINDKGRDQTIIQSGPDGEEFVLHDPQRAWPTKLVYTQQDIRQVQMAKAALRTAIDLLLEKANLLPTDIQQVYLAGAFGNHLDPVNIVALGLVPQVKLDIIRPIGNAAASGAAAALVSLAKRQEAAIIQAQTTFVELADHPDFQRRFLERMNFEAIEI